MAIGMGEVVQEGASSRNFFVGAAVRFEGITKSFHGAGEVISNLTMNIPAGRLTTFLGPSGSGKTTTLMMLAGFVTPTSGSIVLGHKSIVDVPPHKRNIGMVFQDYALFPHLTVMGNVCYPLRARGFNKADARRKADAALALVELTQFSTRYPNQLSGGQKQRVALARALVFEPSLVLLDEPLGALDKQLRERMQSEIRQLQMSLGVTMVSVTHDQSEALTMSDNVVVFRSGRIEQMSSPEALYENPSNAFVASFVGDSNLLDGTIEEVSRDHASVRIRTGDVLHGRCDWNPAIGQAATYLVRPERPVPAQSGAPVGNTLAGTVREVVYLGDHQRLHIELPDRTDFLVKARLNEIALHLRANDNLTLAWGRSEGRVLPPRSAPLP